MKKVFISTFLLIFVLMLSLQACQPAQASPGITGHKVLAAESFLADIAQNVAGSRLNVDTLIPLGVDPHGFEPTPQDVARISDCNILIINGAGFEEWLQEVITNAGGNRVIIEASSGLKSRETREGEEAVISDEEHHHEGDPHFWLDPLSVIQYAENIRDGLIQADPEGKELYSKNADLYITNLKDLDQTIQEQVAAIPVERRLIVTNHESFGYFADRYGFKIIGTIIPSVSTDSSPSAQQVARLIDHIKSTGATAIFLETGTNPQLAEQISRETGIKVITGLYTHSITGPGGNAPSYIEMMKYNVGLIIKGLK